GATEWRPLSELPEFAGAIPTAPPPGMAAAPMASSAAEAQVSGPAIGLIVTGALNLLLSIARAMMKLMGVGMNTFQTMHSDGPQQTIMNMMSTFGLLFGGIGLIGGLIILLGG